MKQNGHAHKQMALCKSGTLNPQSDQVRANVFRVSDFFDARDFVQVKYEMLRSVEVDGKTVRQSATLFGLSRVTWYQIKGKFDQEGLIGLLPQIRGPNSKKKLLRYHRR